MNGGIRRKKFNRGRWQIQRERCFIDSTVPPEGIVDPVAIADVVPGVLKKLGLADRHWFAVLEEKWEGIVGKDVAKHAKPGRLDDRGLVVFVDSSVWLNELVRYGRKQILANLHKQFGKDKIASVSFQLDPDGR
jgi:hypothetical protein